MKICIVTSIFPPDIGGPATYVYELARRICTSHEVHVVTYGQPAYEKVEGIDGGFFHVHRTEHPSVPKLFALPLRMMRLARLISKVTSENKCDVIYVMDTNVAGIPGVVASKFTGVPVVLKYVGDWAWELSFKKKWTKNFLLDFYKNPRDNGVIRIVKALQKYVVNSSVCVIVPSNYLMDVLLSWHITSPIYVIPNAVAQIGSLSKKEDAQVDLNLSGRNILTAGRLVSWKGVDVILESFPGVLKKFPKTSLLIVGEGPEEESLKTLSRSLDLEKNVFFLGKLGNPKLRKYMRAADLFILPSLYEGMSHVILEAMLMELPIIASNVAGNPDTIEEGVTGILIEPRDNKLLTARVSDVFDNPEDTKRLVENARKKALTVHSWENHVKELFALWKRQL